MRIFKHSKFELVMSYLLGLLAVTIPFYQYSRYPTFVDIFFSIVIMIVLLLLAYSSIKCKVIASKQTITVVSLFKTKILDIKNIIGFETDKEHIVLVTDSKPVAIEKRLKDQNGLTFALFIRANYNYIGEN